MSQEKQQGRGNSNKGREKRQPKRGPGVAELERMRLEEQQHNVATAAAASPSILLPLPSPADFPVSTSSFNSIVPVPHHLPPLPPCPPCKRGRRPRQNSLVFGHGGAEEEREFKPIFSFGPIDDLINHGAVMKNQERESQQKTTSTVNVSVSPPPSSGVNLRMEPPSNQIYCRNSTLTRPEEEKIFKSKRWRPFSPYELPGSACGGSTTFQSIFPSSSHSCFRWDGLPSSGQDTLKFEQRNAAHRLDPSGSNVVADVPSDDLMDEDGSLDGRFLTSGSPTACSESKSKQPISATSTHNNEFIIFQASMKQPFIQREEVGRRQRLYQFLPMWPSSHPSSSSLERPQEAEFTVDLELKL